MGSWILLLTILFVYSAFVDADTTGTPLAVPAEKNEITAKLSELQKLNNDFLPQFAPVISSLINTAKTFNAEVSPKNFSDLAQYFFFLSVFAPAAEASAKKQNVNGKYKTSLIEKAAEFQSPFKTDEAVLVDLIKKVADYPPPTTAASESEAVRSFYISAFSSFTAIGEDYLKEIAHNEAYVKETATHFESTTDNVALLLNSAAGALSDAAASIIERDQSAAKAIPLQYVAATSAPHAKYLENIITKTPEILNAKTFPIFSKLTELTYKMTDKTVGKSVQDNSDFVLYLSLLANYINLPPNSLFHNPRVPKILLYYTQELKMPRNLGQGLGEICLYDFGYYIFGDHTQNRVSDIVAAKTLKDFSLTNYEEPSPAVREAYTHAYKIFANLAADYFKQLSKDDWIKEAVDVIGISTIQLTRFYEFISFVATQIPFALQGQYKAKTLKKLLCQLTATDTADVNSGRAGVSLNYFNLVQQLAANANGCGISSLVPAALIVALTGLVSYGF